MSETKTPWRRDEVSGTLVCDLSDWGGRRPTYPDGGAINLRLWTPEYDASGEDIGGWRINVGGQKYLIVND